MKKRNVLHLVEYLYLGGIERLLEQLALNSKDKVNFHFFSYETTKLDGIGKQIQDSGFPVYTYKKSPGRDWELVKKLIKIIEENKIEILHTHDFGPIEYAVILKIRFPWLKIVHTQHTIIHFIRHRKYTMFFQFASFFYSRMIAVSEHVKGTIVQYCPYMKRSVLIAISNGVDTDIFTPGGKYSDKKLLRLVSVARLSYEKNFNYLLNTCKLLNEAGIPFVLHHAGTAKKPEVIEEIKQYILDHSLQDQVILHGFSNDAKIILDQADIFLSASHTEGHPVAVLEAMACEKLCFCSDIPPHRELGVEAIELFDKDDEEALFKKLVAHYEGRDEFDVAHKISEARSIVVNNFSIQRMVNKYVQQY